MLIDLLLDVTAVFSLFSAPVHCLPVPLSLVKYWCALLKVPTVWRVAQLTVENRRSLQRFIWEGLADTSGTYTCVNK